MCQKKISSPDRASSISLNKVQHKKSLPKSMIEIVRDSLSYQLFSRSQFHDINTDISDARLDHIQLLRYTFRHVDDTTIYTKSSRIIDTDILYYFPISEISDLHDRSERKCIVRSSHRIFIEKISIGCFFISAIIPRCFSGLCSSYLPLDMRQSWFFPFESLFFIIRRKI